MSDWDAAARAWAVGLSLTMCPKLWLHPRVGKVFRTVLLAANRCMFFMTRSAQVVELLATRAS